MAADCEIGSDGVVLSRSATHLGLGTYPGHVAISRGATAPWESVLPSRVSNCQDGV